MQNEWLDANAEYIFDYDHVKIPVSVKKKIIMSKNMGKIKKDGKLVNMGKKDEALVRMGKKEDSLVMQEEAADMVCIEWDDYSYEWIEIPCDEYDEDAQPEWVSDVTDTIVSYGFNPDTAATWLEDREQTWQTIEAEQQAQDIAQMEQDIKEIGDKASVFFTNMMDDLRLRQEFDQELREDQLTALLDEGLQKINEAERNALDELEYSLENLVYEMQNVDLGGSDVLLAKKAQLDARNANYSAYGYAAVSIGAAAILAYALNKRFRKSSVTEPLLNDDTFNRA